MSKAESERKAHGRIIKSDFKPASWAKNRHIQTIWPRFLQKRKKIAIRNERVKTPDNDFIDLAWSPKPDVCKGLVVIFHGLEGSIRSHYANDVVAALFKQNWQSVLMHFRGCSGEANHTTRTYHSGDTRDASFILDRLRQQFPDQFFAGVGFSLGGNMLLKLLGENPLQRWLQTAAAISAPLKLAECAQSINQGFSRVYQRYLLNSMKRTLTTKMQRLDYSNDLLLSEAQIKAIDSFRDFDEKVTAPIHGFEDAVDYYEKCSGYNFLQAIHTPTLIMHAKDDPFMNENVIPEEHELARSVTLELSERGGHVGFMQGPPWAPSIWFHQRLATFLDEQLGRWQAQQP
ncbi:hydrolase [Alteromonas facilis]|uniref:hydrolase n=1 Tax=Alteromonas facilis TaxID=2048004 RepID=UPI000C29519C|nr:hydrolase [Alteromonas facilis]